MGIVAAIMVSVLKCFRVSRIYWVYLLLPGLAVYAVATGARASAVRACVMAGVYFAAPALRRKADVPSGLAMAALLILAWDPRQLRDLGFIFSFTVVVGLIVMLPLILKPMERLWKPDPMRLQPDTRLKSLGRESLRYVGSLAALSLAAWLASAPLTAYYFERVTPIALLGNIFVIPVAFLIVLSGCLSLVLGSCVDFLAVVFNLANHALVSLLVLFMHAMRQVPLGSLPARAPPVWAVALWYAALAAGALRLHARRAAGQRRARPSGSGR